MEMAMFAPLINMNSDVDNQKNGSQRQNAGSTDKCDDFAKVLYKSITEAKEVLTKDMTQAKEKILSDCEDIKDEGYELDADYNIYNLDLMLNYLSEAYPDNDKVTEFIEKFTLETNRQNISVDGKEVFLLLKSIINELPDDASGRLSGLLRGFLDDGNIASQEQTSNQETVIEHVSVLQESNINENAYHTEISSHTDKLSIKGTSKNDSYLENDYLQLQNDVSTDFIKQSISKDVEVGTVLKPDNWQDFDEIVQGLNVKDVEISTKEVTENEHHKPNSDLQNDFLPNSFSNLIMESLQAGPLASDDFVTFEENLINQTTTEVDTGDILKQVLKHSKVNLGEEKSEMLIDLKPDHLGKLSLKVITERGIVTAKFVAESQQVKQILESNMQTLREAFQKQGILFQEVSVSVGDNSTGQFSQQYQGSRHGRYKGLGTLKTFSVTDGVQTKDGYITGYNDNSSINLIA